LAERTTHVDRHYTGVYLQPHEAVLLSKEKKKSQLDIADVLISQGASLSIKNNDK